MSAKHAELVRKQDIGPLIGRRWVQARRLSCTRQLANGLLNEVRCESHG